VNTSGRTVQVPLQPGTYRSLPHGSPNQYQVVERTCAVLPFGYTNTPFIWTKVVKVLARAMRARGIRCLWFIDDCLLALPSRPLALIVRKTVEDLFVLSDLTRTPDKGVWEPTQTIPDHSRFRQRQPPDGSRSPNDDTKTFQDQPRTSCVGPHRV
jgi:hypothetical protein